MKFVLRLWLILALGVGSAHAAAIATLTGPQDPSQLQATLNQVIQTINSGVPGFGSTFVGKNYLDNGAFAINQRGTAITTGGTTSGPAATAYTSDRWAVETNVTSGVGRGQVVTSVTGVTFAPTLQNAVSLYRNSGALTQPISLEQEIETQRFRQLQGKSAIMSCWLAANAGAPTGVTATFHLFTGTGTNEGLGASTVYGSAVGMTASPALTPALTGLATAGSFTTAALPTATMTRFSSGPIAVPLTATEGIFEVDWTPGAETAGTTDGIVVQGCQLEQADINQTTASAFEFLPPMYDLARSQRFYYELDESATIFVAGACKAESVTVATCWVPFPVPMAAAAQMTYANGFATETTVAGGTLGACTTLATASTVANTAPNNLGVLVGCTATTVPAAGSAGMLYSNNSTGKIKASADF